MSIVFVAGPLSGLFVQPLIGVLADSSTSRFGRRRPYMLVGAIICALAMLLLGFTKDIASWFLDRDSSANANLTIWLAVLAIYCIDFSINAGKPEPPSQSILLTIPSTSRGPCTPRRYTPNSTARTRKRLGWPNAQYRQCRWILRVCRWSLHSCQILMPLKEETSHSPRSSHSLATRTSKSSA